MINHVCREHDPWAQTVGWPGLGAGGGGFGQEAGVLGQEVRAWGRLQGWSGGAGWGKRDICDTFNKDNFKKYENKTDKLVSCITEAAQGSVVGAV